MPPNDLALHEFNPQTATEDEWEALYAFDKQAAAEEYPEVPHLPFDAFKRSMIDRPPTLTIYNFVISRQDDGVVMARLRFNKSFSDSNRGFFMLEFLPEYRNQGLATDLLTRLINVAQREGTCIFRTDTSNHIPAGAAFARQIGGNEKLIIYMDILDIANVRPDQRQDWHDLAEAPIDGYIMGFWENGVPEESLDEVAGILNWMESNSPSKNSEASRATKENVRQFGENIKNLGRHFLVGYIKDVATNTMVALIMAYWNPNQPDFALLDVAAVKPPHDAYTLGRQLKAATLEKMLEAHPQIMQVSSGELSTNESLIRANRDLGFITKTIMTMWEIETEQIQNYLAAQQMAPAQP